MNVSQGCPPWPAIVCPGKNLAVQINILSEIYKINGRVAARTNCVVQIPSIDCSRSHRTGHHQTNRLQFKRERLCVSTGILLTLNAPYSLQISCLCRMHGDRVPLSIVVESMDWVTPRGRRKTEHFTLNEFTWDDVSLVLIFPTLSIRCQNPMH